MFGPDYEIIPVLVLTAAKELFRFVPIGKTYAVLLGKKSTCWRNTS